MRCRPSALTPCFWLVTYHIAWNQRAQWLSSALEDRPRRHRCLTLTPVASQLTPRRRPGVGSAARRASKTFRPTNTPKKLRTRRLRHEPRVEFSQGARVVDPAFGMGCRVRHPNILTSRERSGYPISRIRAPSDVHADATLAVLPERERDRFGHALDRVPARV